jgi:hypothetical protein
MRHVATRYAPACTLFVASPLIGEYLLGNISVDLVWLVSNFHWPAQEVLPLPRDACGRGCVPILLTCFTTCNASHAALGSFRPTPRRLARSARSWN